MTWKLDRNWWRRWSAAFLWFVLLDARATDACANSPYATELVQQNGYFGNQSLYNDPTAVLGEPTSLAVNADPGAGYEPYHIKIVEPAYNRDTLGNKVITTLARQRVAGTYQYGSLTIKFDHQVYDDPTNPYGIDLNVFGNAFYVGGGTEGGYVSDATDMRQYYLAGGVFAEPLIISVSPDNENWYTYSSGPYGDTAFPTQGFAWDGEQHDQTGNGWTDEKMDFTKPVNPTLNTRLGVFGSPMSVVDALQAYVGSGGGTGIDLQESGFEWIQYVQVNAAAGFSDGEIDAFSDVRPMRVGEALSITPENVVAQTPLHFQSAMDESHTEVLAQFTGLSDLAKLATASVTDVVALEALPAGELLASYQLDVLKLIDSAASQPTFTVDYELSPGSDYVGDGTDLQLLQWDGTNWLGVEFTSDSVTGRFEIADWTNPATTFAILAVGPAEIDGDFNRDNVVDALDYIVWRMGGSASTEGKFQVWRENFGNSSSPPQLNVTMAATVPEPSATLLVLAAGVAATMSRRATHALHGVRSA